MIVQYSILVLFIIHYITTDILYKFLTKLKYFFGKFVILQWQKLGVVSMTQEFHPLHLPLLLDYMS